MLFPEKLVADADADFGMWDVLELSDGMDGMKDVRTLFLLRKAIGWFEAWTRKG